MGKVVKTLGYDGAVIITAIDSTDIVNEAITRHNLSPVAAAALGRTLTATLEMGVNLKNKRDSVTVNIKGDGELGSVVTACDGALKLRGYVENPFVELPLKSNGKLDVSGAVGHHGTLTVVKDLGMKEPFTAQVELVSGEIGEDFTNYYAISEQQPSVVAVGVLIGTDGKCLSAGGIFIHLLPFCSDSVIADIEKIVPELASISRQLKDTTPFKLIEHYFGDVEVLQQFRPRFSCKCSRGAIDRVLDTISYSELLEMVEKDGQIEVGCQFCGEKYVYTKQDIEKRKK